MQLKIHQSKARFRVAAWGRQSGKSTFATNELLKRAWEKRGIYWFVAPTYKQSVVQFRRMLNALRPTQGVVAEKSLSEFRLVLTNGSEIFFQSGDNYDNLRSETLDGVVIDEVRDQHPDLWPMVIRPMLATTKGWAVFISTPRGYDQFYDMFCFGQNDSTGQWASFQAPSTCNPLIDELELNDARRIMTDAQFSQEWLAEFRDLLAGRAYPSFSELNLADANPFYTQGQVHHMLPIVVALDFNLSPMAWTLGQKRADHYYWFDEVWLENSHTQQAAEALAQKIIELKHQKLGVVLAGDATSKAGQRAAAGQSDYDIICQTLDHHSITWINVTPDSNPLVKDRVNTLNAKLKNGMGEASVWINREKCPQLIRDLQRVVWKQNAAGVILDQHKDTTLTHSSDGVGYAIHALTPLKYDATVPSMRIIQRR
jgi:hypothetical protein